MKKVSLICLLAITQLLPAQIYDGLGIVGYDTCYFDYADCGYLVLDTSITDNIWQIGPPQKMVFDAPYSMPNALMTDTSSTYPAGNHSYFDLLFDYYNLPFYGNILISFYHKLYTDSLTEGGYIEISYDKGDTWTNIVYDTEYFMFNEENSYTQFDTITGGIPAFTGTINEWTKVRLQWVYDIPIKDSEWSTDTILLRFNFVSDMNETSRDGWMIDNFSLDFIMMPGQVPVSDAKDIIVTYPNPSDGIVNLKSEKIKIKHIDIFDSRGFTISSYKYILKNLFVLDEEFQSGVYFYKAELENNQILEGKFIIE